MAGVASRRACEELIREGRVSVEGEIERSPARKVSAASSRVRLDGRPVRPQQRLIYVIVHKPTGCVVTASDPQGRRTVFDLVPPLPARVFPVGRLDLNSTGLVLLTNDGEAAERLGHPRHGVERIYRIKVSGQVGAAALERLERGVELDDGPARALRARVVKRNQGSTVLELAVGEGRFRLVRRMMQALGHPVRRLARIAIGPLILGALPLGEARPLTVPEARALRRALGLGEGAGQG